MKKSILIGVLAALMLFAFTACENNAPTSPLYGRLVESITPVEYPDIVYKDSATAENILQDADPADIVLKVTFSDGSVAEYNGLELGLTVNGTEKAEGARVYTAKYGQGNSYNVVIPYYIAEVVAVDVSAAETLTIAPNASSITSKGVKVVYGYNGKEIAKDMPATTPYYPAGSFGFPKNQTGSVDWDNIKEGYSNTFRITNLNCGSFGIAVTDIEDVEVRGTWTLTVKTPEAPQISDIKVTMNPTNEEIFVGDGFADVPYMVTFRYDDETVTLINGVDDVTWKLSYDNYTEEYPFETAKSYSDVKLVISSADAKASVTLPAFTVINDYPETFTVSAGDNLSDKKWTINDTVASDYFEFAVDDWASGTVYGSGEAPELELTADDFEGITKILPGSADGDTVYPRFVYKNAGKATEQAVYTTGVKVTVEE